MEVPPQLLRLPEGLAETGDPEPENPFKAGDPRHEVWAEKTREAEEAVARARADFHAQPVTRWGTN